MTTSINHLGSDGNPTGLGYNWGTVQAGAAVVATKWGVENTSTRALGGNALLMALVAIAGNDWINFFACALDTVTISRPFNLAAALGGSGGSWSQTGLVYYVITAINANGETVASLELSATLASTGQKVTLTWTQVPGATGYKIYRSFTSGLYATPCLRTTVGAGSTVTFIDDGSALSAGAPPSANTTGGAAPNYGTPPASGPGPLSFGVLAIGQQVFYWEYATVPSSASEAGNPRLCLRQFSES